MAGPTRPRLDDLIATLATEGLVLPAGRPAIEWFGDGPVLARALADLVRRGVKRASAGLVWAWDADGDPFPEVGDVEIIIDWTGHPLAVVEVTEVRILPFDQVDAAFARDEGEGDGTLAWWRDAHWRYFSRECARLGHAPSQTMPVLCRRFRLLHVLGDLTGPEDPTADRGDVIATDSARLQPPMRGPGGLAPGVAD